MSAYRDSSVPIDQRVEDLLGQMTLEEKAGLMFHPPILMNPDGSVIEEDAGFVGGSHDRADRRAPSEPLQHLLCSGAAPARRVAQPPPGDRSIDASRHPGHDLVRPAPQLRGQPRRRVVVGGLLALAGADRLRCAERRRCDGGVRRHRAPGVPRRRRPRRASSDGRSRDRAALGARHAHLRPGRRSRRRSCSARTCAVSRARSSARTLWLA